MTTILDYGMGNLASVARAFAAIGEPTRIAADLVGAERLVLPGVGAFGAAMERLGALRASLVEFAAAGKPLLGICLGQQLLFEESEEFSPTAGLGLLPGRVRYLPGGTGLKVPLVGWCPVSVREAILGAGIHPSDQFYFVHSLYCDADSEDVAMTAEHGIRFPAAVRRANVWGTQFHPEKSGAPGLRVLRNFVSC